jgi:hypothetical protein
VLYSLFVEPADEVVNISRVVVPPTLEPAPQATDRVHLRFEAKSRASAIAASPGMGPTSLNVGVELLAPARGV